MAKRYIVHSEGLFPDHDIRYHIEQDTKKEELFTVNGIGGIKVTLFPAYQAKDVTEYLREKLWKVIPKARLKALYKDANREV